MLLKKSLYCAATAALFACTASGANAQPASHIVIAPTCLLQQSSQTFKSLATNKSFALIATDTNGVHALNKAKHQAKNSCGGFRDVTRSWNKPSYQQKNPQTFLTEQTNSAKRSLRTHDETYKVRHPEETSAVLKNITPDNMWQNLTKLTSFQDRYAGSEHGVEAAHWLKDKIDTIAKTTGHTDDFTSYFVETGSYQQPSLVTKFGKGDGPGIVIGAHMDTLNSFWSNKPGADDDGSGTVTLMETARSILASGMHFEKPIYFIWYSAEEMGLVGSDYVVADFQEKKIPVAAAMQLDMTGYAHDNSPTMWLMQDYTDKKLTAFLATLISTYVKKPVDYSMCGYACSDHASWQQNGIPASFPFESKMGQDDPYIHTSNDTMDALSLEHMTDYAKLATAYAVELAVPVK